MWVRREKERELQAAGKGELPWPLYLVASVLVAIASVSVCAAVDRVLLCLQCSVWFLQATRLLNCFTSPPAPQADS